MAIIGLKGAGLAVALVELALMSLVACWMMPIAPLSAAFYKTRRAMEAI